MIRTNFGSLRKYLRVAAFALLGACSESSFHSLPQNADDAVGAQYQPPGESSIVPEKRASSLQSTFETTLVKTASFPFVLSTNQVQTQVQMSTLMQNLSESRAQVTRLLTNQSFKQGNRGTLTDESIPQAATRGLVDILIVIDNSGSMVEEQVNLSSKVSDLLVALSGTDWQIGIITTSPTLVGTKAQCVMTRIAHSMPNYKDLFASAIMAGTTGLSNEQGIRQAVVGLACAEAPWLRDTAAAAILFVSDEDNCSFDGRDCGTEPWNSPSYLTDYVNNTLKARVPNKAVGYYGLITPSLSTCPSAMNVSKQYMSLISSENYGNICDASYSNTLQRISKNIASTLKSSFELQNIPSANSLILSLKTSATSLPTPIDKAHYTLSGKTITFSPGKEPPAGSTILANYLVGATPTFKSVTLSQDPAPETLDIRINNGNPLAASDYTLTGRTLTFASEPPNLADVTVTYRMLAPALQSVFPLSQAPLTKSLKVYVNDQETKDFAVDTMAKTITFTVPPQDGAPIRFDYVFSQGPQLRYALPMAQDARNLKVFSGTRELKISQSSGDSFTIDADDFVLNGTLTVSYETPNRSKQSFMLEQKPVEGSLRLDSKSSDCILGREFEVMDRVLTSLCEAAATLEFTLSYQYLEAQNSFRFPGVSDPEKGTWAVYLDGSLIADYSRTGTVFQLGVEPPLGSKVSIVYTPQE